MLASWRGARLEVVQVVRGVGSRMSFTPYESQSVQVIDNVLKDPEASDVVLYNRAKVSGLRIVLPLCSYFRQGLLLTGAIFKSTVPDESDEERRELERYDSLLCLIYLDSHKRT